MAVQAVDWPRCCDSAHGGVPDGVHAQFREAVKDRLGRTIGYLQQQGDRTIVQDRCFVRLWWVISDGNSRGTYSHIGEKLADSPLPFMLLSKPSPSCPTPVQP